MKKIFALLFSVVFVLSIAGCGSTTETADYVDPNGLGIEMTLQSVSVTSAMIVFTLHSDDKSDEARTGAAYWLEKEENGSWDRVPTITDEIVLFADTYTIRANVETEIPVDWSYLYGELGHGKYRLGKEVLGEHEPGHSSWYTYYAEFELVNITC